jgi:hypothetical protein
MPRQNSPPPPLAAAIFSALVESTEGRSPGARNMMRATAATTTTPKLWSPGSPVAISCGNPIFRDQIRQLHLSAPDVGVVRSAACVGAENGCVVCDPMDRFSADAVELGLCSVIGMINYQSPSCESGSSSVVNFVARCACMRKKQVLCPAWCCSRLRHSRGAG